MDIYLLERSELVVMEKKGSRKDNIDTKQKISKHIVAYETFYTINSRVV